MNEFADYCSILSLIISGATLIVSLRVKASIQDAKKHVYLNSQMDDYIHRITALKDALYKAYTRKDWGQVKEEVSQIKSLIVLIDKIKCKSFNSDLSFFIKSCDLIIYSNFVLERTKTPLWRIFQRIYTKEYTKEDVINLYSHICQLSDLLKFEKSQL
ncbi:hypothetical protein [Alistipes provencensis]|jgi:hypothetical protein|uniref:hypothetical protein n=1 Tax=Alistipes provencensis TaxID=1816676 RepID=UPI0011C6F2FB|nr:hypothetical protein [Alistipes provencensis]